MMKSDDNATSEDQIYRDDMPAYQHAEDEELSVFRPFLIASTRDDEDDDNTQGKGKLRLAFQILRRGYLRTGKGGLVLAVLTGMALILGE